MTEKDSITPYYIYKSKPFMEILFILLKYNSLTPNEIVDKGNILFLRKNENSGKNISNTIKQFSYDNKPDKDLTKNEIANDYYRPFKRTAINPEFEKFSRKHEIDFVNLKNLFLYKLKIPINFKLDLTELIKEYLNQVYTEFEITQKLYSYNNIFTLRKEIIQLKSELKKPISIQLRDKYEHEIKSKNAEIKKEIKKLKYITDLSIKEIENNIRPTSTSDYTFNLLDKGFCLDELISGFAEFVIYGDETLSLFFNEKKELNKLLKEADEKNARGEFAKIEPIISNNLIILDEKCWDYFQSTQRYKLLSKIVKNKISINLKFQF